MSAFFTLPRLLALHILIWTALPGFLQLNPPLDVVEGFAWGSEWLLGTDKHPPLQAWLLEIFTAAFRPDHWPAYFLSALSCALACWWVYRTARALRLPRHRARLAALLPLLMHYFQLTAIEFNPNVLQLPLWSALAYCFVRAWQAGRHRQPALDWWAGAGALAGAGLYAKYSFALFPLALFLFLLSSRENRALFKMPGPWLALVCALLVFLPQALWLVDNDFSPLRYAASRASAAEHWWQHLTRPLAFLSAQVLAWLGPLLLLAVFWRQRVRPVRLRPRAQIVLALAFLPCALMLLPALLTGRELKDMWGMPLWNFAPLAFLTLLPLRFSAVRQRWGWRVGLGLYSLYALALVVMLVAAPLWMTGKGERGNFGGAVLGREIAAVIREQNLPSRPVLLGDIWLAGNAAWYLPQRGRVMTDGDPARAPWITEQDLRQQGGIVLWNAGSGLAPMPSALARRYPHAIVLPSRILVPWRNVMGELDHLPPVAIGLAIVRPNP